MRCKLSPIVQHQTPHAAPHSPHSETNPHPTLLGRPDHCGSPGKKGYVHLAADAIGCDPSTIYTRIKESEAVAECAKLEDGKVDDVAEMVLYNALLSEDMRLALDAAKFRLNTKGRHRGYSEKVDVEHGVGKSILELVHEIVTVPADVNGTPNDDNRLA
jgi:hypothetical protein